MPSPLKTSVFFKMLCVILVTVLIVYGLVFTTFRTLFHPPGHGPGGFHDNMDHYAEYLVKDIAAGGGLPRAQALSKSLGVDFRAEGRGWNWATAADLPEFAALPSHHHAPLGPPPLFGKHARPAFPMAVDFPDGPARVAVFLPRAPEFEGRNLWAILPLLAGISFTLIASFFLLRGIFQPLRSLIAGVARVAEGDFEARVAYEGRDELGVLAKAFNDMAQKIKAMMERQKTLLIDVSHELRSPLARAIVALDAVTDAVPKAQIAEEIQEMDALIHQLLEGARLEQLSVAPMAVEDLVREMAEKYPRVAVPAKVPKAVLVADRDRLRIVLRNLIENAVKYSPETGSIRLEVAEPAGTGMIEIAVVDEGEGVPEAELPHVFEPFYRVDKSRTRATGGYGLGLSLCRKIVEAHGGRIAMTSRLGTGTRVVIRLPHTK